jgi:predicted Zn-dependent protease
MLDDIRNRFRRVAPAVEFCSLRYASEEDEMVSVRQDVLQPVYRATDAGAMVTVAAGGGMGYAAACDLSEAGLRDAVKRAEQWARASAGRSAVDSRRAKLGDPKGEYAGPELMPWASVGLEDKVALLMGLSKALKTDERIVDWDASLWHTAKESLYLTAGGGEVHQRFSYMVPGLSAVANHK